MTVASIPNRPAGSDARSISAITANFDALIATINGNLDETNLTDAIASQMGISRGGVIRKGKSIVTTSESRSSTSYGLMATADRVQGIVLPTDGLICVAYQATWKESVAAAAKAGLFIGSNQIALAVGGNNYPQEAVVASNSGGPSAANIDTALASFSGGLVGGHNSGVDRSSDVTTGQVVGLATWGSNTNPGVSFGGSSGNQTGLNNEPRFATGPCYIFAAAGTYDISVQFKAVSGSVSVKNRKLWVWAMAF